MQAKMFRVRGLYQGPMNVLAESEEEARRMYHDAHPGFAGTILSVEERADVNASIDLETGEVTAVVAD